jgi:uncharacterized RDD family membrane protein YckC
MTEFLLKKEHINDSILKPTLLSRLKSTFIDYTVIFLLLLLVSTLLDRFMINSIFPRLLVFFIVLMYEPFFTSLGQTLGQKIMNLRVYDALKYKNENQLVNISLPKAMVRYVLKTVLGFVSLFTIHSDSFGQAIHDKAAQSIMTHS